jgi:cytidylate kinase
MTAARRPRGVIVAVDGPSGAGKSTAARALAARLGYTFLDTGAMYRAVALRALEEVVPLDDGARLTGLAGASRLELSEDGRQVRVDGRDVSGLIRTPEVSRAASLVSAHAGVRRVLVARQQELGAPGGVVLDGRDIGTAVFPDAEVKLFVTADPRRRAERRSLELQEAGYDADPAAIEAEIRARDEADSSRADSPLTRAPDAVEVDTTRLSPEEVVDAMLALVRERLRG